MNVGKVLSVILLWAVAFANVGFTTSMAFAPGQVDRSAVCKSCDACPSDNGTRDAANDCSASNGMSIQADLTMAVKLQPKLDSPEAESLLQEPLETQQIQRRPVYRSHLARALPDRLAQEHIVLRI